MPDLLRRLTSRTDAALAVVGLLLAANLLAIAGLAASRRDVAGAIERERALEIRSRARAFETLLAQQHGELASLAVTPALADLGRRGGEERDPVVRRWERLDAEAALLLYLQASPAVRRLRVVRDEADGEEAGETDVVAVAGRGGTGGAEPQLLTPGAEPPAAEGWLWERWPLGEGGGHLEAWVDPDFLLASTAPGFTLERSPAGREGRGARAPEGSGSAEPVASPLWSPPFAARLVRTGGAASEVTGAVERLAGRYRLILLLNLALLPLSVLLGALTVRRVRRLARLESERRQQEQLRALERRVERSERLASLGRFAAGIAHEINNPLAGMSNYLSLLEEDLTAGEGEEARRWVTGLREGLDRTAAAVRQVLTFAEPGRGRAERVDLAEVVRRTLDFLEAHPECEGVELRAEGPEALPFNGDGRALEQLVLNLVLNACQARPATGGVEVRVRELAPQEVGAERRMEEGGVELAVLDRGPGFSPEISDPFEPFASGRGSTGLGLAVCQGIVHEHGGRIEARNRRDGPGAEVVARLPRVALEEEIVRERKKE